MKANGILAVALAMLLVLTVSCAAEPAGSSNPSGSSAASAGAATTAGPEGTSQEETTERSIGISEIISAEEIGAILGLKPAQYSELLTPTAIRKIGTYTFATGVSDTALTYLEIGLIIGAASVAKYGYRDPATPRTGSEITSYTVLGTPAYLDTQTYDTEVDGKIVTIVNNYQLICFQDDIYYYLSTGYFAPKQVDQFRTKLPALLEKLIQNTKAKLG